MKVRLLTSPTLIILIALLIPLKVFAQKTSPVANIAGRQVSLELVKRKDLSPVKWPDENVTLTIDNVEIKEGEIVPRLLEARGIVPDNESYTLFYDLNPQLDNLEQLNPHSKYKLPKVAGGPLLAESLKKGHLVLLTVDEGLKTELKNNSKAMTSLAQKFSGLGRRRFDEPRTSEAAKRYVKDLAGWYDGISLTITRRKAMPIRRVSLVQMVNEAEALTRILSRAVNSKHKVSPADYEQITLIHQDIGAIADKWIETMGNNLPPAESQYEVEVVIRGKDSSAVRNVRVYYVMNGYYLEPPTNPPVKSSAFPGLGERVSATLSVHNWKIWVARDGEPGKQLVKPMLVWVNKRTTVEFNLQ
jgi:hypothetical protein